MGVAAIHAQRQEAKAVGFAGRISARGVRSTASRALHSPVRQHNNWRMCKGIMCSLSRVTVYQSYAYAAHARASTSGVLLGGRARPQRAQRRRKGLPINSRPRRLGPAQHGRRRVRVIGTFDD